MSLLRTYLDGLYIKSLVAAAVLATTNSGTTGVDMKSCRSGVLILNHTVGSDVATTFSIQHSADNGSSDTYADVITLTDGQLATTAFLLKEIPRMKRYLRAKWTRSASAGDSFWSIQVAGKLAQIMPVS